MLVSLNRFILLLVLLYMGSETLVLSQLISHSDSIQVPYDTATSCPQFFTELTNGATKNLVECTFELCPSDQITIHFCGEGLCEGDTFIRLVDTSDDRTVFSNDDYCVYCSGGTYIVDGQSCRTFSLRQGCYADEACRGEASLTRIKIYFNPIPPAEVAALSSLYNATNGDEWLWPEDANVWDFTNKSVVDNLCSVWHQWYGVFCDCVSNQTNCFVNKVSLSGLGLAGRIDHVPFNQLTFLKTLDLSDNHLHGLIPPHVSTLGGLQTLNLGSNFFSGTLPFYLTKLNESLLNLRLFDNHLGGTIPDFLRLFGRLQALEMGGNWLDGTFPPAICNLRKLMIFNVGGNNLHGTIPDCFYENGSFFLQDFDLHNNMFSGSLKDDIRKNYGFNIIKLSSNQFTGTIPPGLFWWLNKAWIFLDRNHFHGSIHHNISRVTYLRDFDLSYNMLTGTLPSSISTLPRLLYFNVEHNKLSGSLHNKFNLTVQRSLRSLVLGANKFTGSLPESLFMPGLVTFSAYDNCLENYVPKSICNSKTLNTLVLDGMQTSPYCGSNRVGFLTGSKEHDAGALECLISSMPRLRVLHLSSLALKGNALESITSVGKYLDHLSLSYNHLTGTIPIAIQSKRWRSLDLAFNSLTGELVETFNTIMVDPNQMEGDDNGEDDDIIAYIPNDDYYKFNASAAFASDISLNINHLSGNVPPELLGKDFSDLDSALRILDGNLFTCNYDKNQIPSSDPAWERYDCGSNSFNASYYFYLATFFFLLVALFAATAYFDLRFQSLVSFVWRFVNAVLSKGDIPRHPFLKESDLVNIYSMYKAFNYLEKIFLVVLLYLLLCMTPLYSALSFFYSSYKHSFAWAVSAAYKTGVSAAIAEFVSFLVFFILLVIIWRHPEDSVNVLSFNSKQVSRAIEADVPMVDVVRYKPVGYTLSASSSFLASSLKWLVMFSVEFGVVGGMNLLFVYVNIVGTRSEVFAVQVALTVFGLVWSSQNIEAVTTFIESKLSRKGQEAGNAPQFSTVYFLSKCTNKMEIARHHYWLQLVMAAFNSVWIPVITVALVSRSCFYYALVTPDIIKSSYVYKTCINRETIATILYCTEYGYQKLATAFTPLFAYSYQCSSVFVVYFAPSLMYTCTIDSFVIPCFQVACSRILKMRSKTKTIHVPDDGNYSGPPSQNPAILSNKRKSMYDKLVRLFKKACVTNFLVPLKIIKVKRAIPSQCADPNMKVFVEEMDEALEDNDSEQTDGFYIHLRMVSPYSGEVYLSSTQEAVKVLSYMFLVLTFGFAFPPLGVAICATLLIYIRFLQWKMRTFVEKVWGYAQLSIQGDLATKNDSMHPCAPSGQSNHPVTNHESKSFGHDSKVDDDFLSRKRAIYGDDVNGNVPCSLIANVIDEEVVVFSHSQKSSRFDGDDASCIVSDVFTENAAEKRADIATNSVTQESDLVVNESRFSSSCEVMTGGITAHDPDVNRWITGSVDDELSRKISRVISFHVRSSLKVNVDAKANEVPVDETSSERQMAMHSCLVALNEQCAGFGDMLYYAKWPVLGTASVFYAFFLFDTSGSKQGMSASYWTLLASVLLPVCAYLFFDKYWLSRGSGADLKRVAVDV